MDALRPPINYEFAVALEYDVCLPFGVADILFSCVWVVFVDSCILSNGQEFCGVAGSGSGRDPKGAYGSTREEYCQCRGRPEHVGS